MRCDSDGEGIFGWMEYFGWRYGWNLCVVVQTVLGSGLRCQHLGGIVGKSGFVSHTKHIAEATNMDLFHS